MTIEYFTLENRRSEVAAKRIMLENGGSDEEANSFAKGLTAGYAWCDTTDDISSVDKWAVINTLDPTRSVPLLDVAAAAMDLNAEQRAHLMGFVSGVRRYIADVGLDQPQNEAAVSAVDRTNIKQP